MVDRAKKPPAISATTPSEPQPIVDIASDNSKVIARLPSGESVEVLLHGATVISWKNADGSENLWLSDAAVLDGTKAVRGGIPICFPVFGPPPKDHTTSSLPQHGFARNSRWEFLGKSTSESSALPHPSRHAPSGDAVKLDFGLGSANLNEAGRKAWPYDFSLVYSVTLGQDGLQTSINVRNEGQEKLEFQVLLHTYFRISDVSKTRVTGLSGVTYIDKVLNASENTQADNELAISSEVDRVYKKIPQSTTSIVTDGKPRFDVIRDNMSDTVIWNPWREKAAGMGDFKPSDGYMKMICVEVGSVDGWTTLEPGDTFEGGQVMKSLL